MAIKEFEALKNNKALLNSSSFELTFEHNSFSAKLLQYKL